MHWRGHALKLLDLVDYCHYMTPMCVLPPVPAQWPGRLARGVAASLGDQRAVAADLAAREPRRPLLAGRVAAPRRATTRIQCPTMLVAGWADGYRNNTFRTVEGLGAAGTPWRLLAGPWAHADPATAIPGPRIDLDHEMVAWWDRWLRGGPPPTPWDDRADLFVRTSTVPEPDLERARGLLGQRAVAARRRRRRWTLELDGPRSLEVEPDVGTSAWIDCAGHLPWGLSRRPARRRRPLADLGLGPPSSRDRRPAAGPAARSAPTRPPPRSR